MTGAQLTNSW